MIRVLPVILAALLHSLFPSAASAAETYPDRPIRLIAQGAAGSGPDVIVRIVTRRMEENWKQPVVIVNRAGGGGLVAGQAAASAAPDGYTLFAPTITLYAVLPEMHDHLPFDPDRDFIPIGLFAQMPMVIAASPALGITSLAELAALARSRPGKLFYSASSAGSLPHLAGERWRTLADAPLTFVPYPGFTAGMQDLAGGRISVIIESLGAMAGAIRAGSVRPLAIGSATRLENHPELPAVSETIPGFTAVGWIALVAPRGTAANRIDRLNEDLKAALADPSVVRQLDELGAVPMPLTPAAARAFIRAEGALWRPLARAADLKTQR